MKLSLVILFFTALTLLSCGSGKIDHKKFTQVITGELQSLDGMSSDSAYAVYYCWANWCGPCISSMKSRLASTKAITDSLKIPIKYNSILYSPSITKGDSILIDAAYRSGIDVYHKSSANALTQKLGISSDFKPFTGFVNEFSVPRILLIDKSNNVLENSFPLLYNQENYIQLMKLRFPNYFKD